MSEQFDEAPDDSLEDELEVDALCERFEAALKAGEHPAIAEYLNSAPESIRVALADELRKLLSAFGEINPEITSAESIWDVNSACNRIGPYTLLEKIGEGGMGEVWVVAQSEPVKRKAALKLIKPGMDSKSVLARFEQERQALALLDHPNIARILDGGLTPDRRSYFVMELVNGLPLIKYCEDAKLGIPERLKLFMEICQAVQHAHHKGIVHRDLKPSNILVAQVDGKPIVKIIDFGVAKVLGDSLTEETISTQWGTVIGTLEYMAPEQTSRSAIDIDTRVDIYSLGVILYELLTGLRPFDSKRLKQASIDQVIRIIREEEPPRPSTRLSSVDLLPSRTSIRRTELKSLTAVIRGDLDWIVMKCLEKDRVRRYETASSLSRDIERYLASEPIEARPPSAMYKLRKFARRNRIPVLASGVVLATLLIAIVSVTWSLYEARAAEVAAIRDRNEAERARSEEKTQRIQADEAKQLAQQQLEQNIRGYRYLLSIFDDIDIREIKSGTEPLETVLARRLTESSKQIELESISDPALVAILQDRLGRTLQGLGFAREALPILEKSLTQLTTSLGQDHPRVLDSLSSIAQCHQILGDDKRAILVFEKALAVGKPKFNSTNIKMLSLQAGLARSLNVLGQHAKAIELNSELLRLCLEHLGPQARLTNTVTNNLAQCYEQTKQFNLALALYQQAVERIESSLGPTHPSTLAIRLNIASTHVSLREFRTALPLFLELLDQHKQKLGQYHPETIKCMHNLAECHVLMGERETAIPMLLDVIRLRKERSLEDHPDQIVSLGSLGVVYRDQGKLNQGIPILEQAVTLSTQVMGKDHTRTLDVRNHLAIAYRLNNQEDKALVIYQELLKLASDRYGPTDDVTVRFTNNLGEFYAAQSKTDLARPLLEKALKIQTDKYGSDYTECHLFRYNLAYCLLIEKKYEEAVPALIESRKNLSKHLGTEHPTTMQCQYSLGKAYANIPNQRESGITPLQEVYALRKKELGIKNQQTLEVIMTLSDLYMALGQYDQAIALIEQADQVLKGSWDSYYIPAIKILTNATTCYLKLNQPGKAAAISEETYQIHHKKFGPDHNLTLTTLETAGLIYLLAANPTKAKALCEQAVNLTIKKLGAEHETTLTRKVRLARIYMLTRDISKEEPLREEILAAYCKINPVGHATRLGAQDEFSDCLLRAKKYSQAEKHLTESFETWQTIKPKVWNLYNSQSRLGAALLGQNKYADAEPHLLKGYEGMIGLESSIPKDQWPKITEAADRLVILYKAQMKIEEVEKWERLRAKAQVRVDQSKK